MIRISDNLEVNKPAPIDDRLGVFSSTASALAYIPEDRRYIGLTVIVDTGSGATEYWFENGVQDGDLTAKSTGGGGGATWGSITGTLSNQTDLQTALNGKFNNPTGTTAQYLDGLGTPTDFPTAGQAGTLVREVRNESGATMTKGTVVYISGASGNKAVVSKAIATGDSTSAQTFGVIQADIPNNQNGFVVVRGDLAGLNTSSYTEGAQLYLSSTTAGGVTMTKQYAPNHLVYIAIVTRVHANQGSIEVAIQNGYELDELHDVVAQTPSNRNGLFFDSADNLWKARAIAKADLPTLDKTDVGLDNVDNTSDANKPISTATQTALDRITTLFQNVSQLTTTSTTAVTLTTFTVASSIIPVGGVIRISGLIERTAGTGNTTVGINVNSGGARYLQSAGTNSQFEMLICKTTSTNVRYGLGASNTTGNSFTGHNSTSISVAQDGSGNFVISFLGLVGTSGATLTVQFVKGNLL